MKARRWSLRALTYLLIVVATLIMFYPVLYIFLGAFTTPSRLLATILLPIPNTANLGIIFFAWGNGLWQAYAFTLLRCLFYIMLALYAGIIGGYIFSKMSFPGKHKLFLLFLSGMVMPAILLIVPMYLMVAWFPLAGGNNLLGQGGHGLINNWRSLFLFSWVSPFAIFAFKQSYDMLPTEYQDAARMDGAGLLTIIFRVYGPLLKPVMAAVIVITFLSIWNDYLWPSLVITDRPAFVPITLLFGGFGVSRGSSAPDPAALLGSLLALWPPALVYIIFQRYFIQGLVASAPRG